MNIKTLAELLNGKVIGDEKYEIKGISEIDDAEEGDLVFIFDPKTIEKSKYNLKIIAAIIPSELNKCNAKSYILVEDIKNAMIKTLSYLYPEPVKSFPGKIENKHIGDSKIGVDVVIGDYTVIGDETIIGDRVVIMPFTYIGNNVEIGMGSKIYPHSVILDRTIIGKNVIIYPGVIIGSDGFGYHKKDDKLIHIPQVGRVIIEDEVEIGACSMIDRSTIGTTVIGKGTKIDNSVHIAHNVKIGSNAIIIAQVGIAGSCKVGNNAVIAGQAGIADHVNIGKDSIVAAKSGVMRDVKDGEVVFGYPADNRTRVMRNEAYFRKLPELFNRVKTLEENK